MTYSPRGVFSQGVLIDELSGLPLSSTLILQPKVSIERKHPFKCANEDMKKIISNFRTGTSIDMFKFSDSLFMPCDTLMLPSTNQTLLGKSFPRNILGFILLPSFACIAHFYLEWNFETLFFWIFGISTVWWRFSSRIPIGLAVVCLGLIPIFLEVSRRDIPLMGNIQTAHLAIWAYFFLVIGVIRQIFEYCSNDQCSVNNRNVRNITWKHHGSFLQETKSDTAKKHIASTRFEMVTLPPRYSNKRQLDVHRTSNICHKMRRKIV